MLKPKMKIVIVYGHDHRVLASTEAAIRAYERQGYRVEPKILTSRELRIGSGLIFQALQELFRDVAAALVFMTDDDLGIANIDAITRTGTRIPAARLVQRLKPRARQNVVFELGYIIARVGEGRYRIFASEELERPSDIQGRFLVHDLSDDNISRVIKELIDENLKLQPRPLPLEDSAYRLEYDNLAGTSSEV